MPTNHKPERNRALFNDYLSGMSRVEVASKYGLAPKSVSKLLYRHGVKLPRDEFFRRVVRNLSHTGGTGRRPVWPDCPDHLRDEYWRLRQRYGYRAAEARAMLEQERRA